MEITASDLTPSIQTRDPGTVTGGAMKLFCVLKWSVGDRYTRTGKVNRKHPYTIII